MLVMSCSTRESQIGNWRQAGCLTCEGTKRPRARWRRILGFVTLCGEDLLAEFHCLGLDADSAPLFLWNLVRCG